jgi:hypothetical protein
MTWHPQGGDGEEWLGQRIRGGDIYVLERATLKTTLLNRFGNAIE